MSMSIDKISTIENSLLIRAYRGERGSTIPVWFMRQAGRYLPEYRELRKKHSMLELIQSPKLAAEVTLQPLRRFAFDGSIIFADILNPLIGMGMQLDFVEGEGPKFYNLIKTTEDIERLKVPDPENNISATLEAIDLVTTELNKKNLPLLGFCGAPFTLAAYMISSSPSERAEEVISFMSNNENSWRELQNKLAQLVGSHLVAQIKAGAKAAQIFDTWVGRLSLEQYIKYVKPALEQVISYYRANCKQPLIYFGRGTEHLFSEIATLNVDVIGVDYNTTLVKAAQLISRPCTLQGNLNPEILAGPKEPLMAEVQKILLESRTLTGHVFNLGHGVLPHTPPENVELVVNMVKEFQL